MTILRHLYLSTACRAPDEPAAPEPVVEAIAAQPALEGDGVAAAALAADPVVEPAPEPPEPKPAPHGNAGKSPWYMREIAQTREEKRGALTRAEAAEQRAADLQAIIERMQSGTDPAIAPAAKAAPSPQRPADFEAAVRAESAKARLYEDTMTVRQAGEGAFADFGDSLAILNAIGVTNDDFVSDVLAVDKAGAHVILDKLAKDPEKAASLVGMDSRRRIAELTRMADAPKTEPKPAPVAEPKPAAPAISRAPAPKPVVQPVAPAAEVDPTTADGNDKMTDAQWEAWYKNKYQKRA